MNYGRHQITVGTQSDYRSFSNASFAQNYPRLGLSSIDDFKFNVLAAKDYMASHGNMTGFDIAKYKTSDFGLTGVVNGGLANSAGTGRRITWQKYSLMGGFPSPRSDAATPFHVQDKWTPSNRFADVRSARRYADFRDRPARESRAWRPRPIDGIKVDASKRSGRTCKVLAARGLSTGNRLEDGPLLGQLRGGMGLHGTPPLCSISESGGQTTACWVDRHGRRGAEKSSVPGSIDQNANM